MKVAVTAKGKDIGSPVDPRFGRCPYFVVVDIDTMATEGLENPGALAGTGAGVAAAQIIADAGAEAVISNVVGPHAFTALNEGDITVYGGAAGSVKSAIEMWKNGQLQQLDVPNAPLEAGAQRRG